MNRYLTSLTALALLAACQDSTAPRPEAPEQGGLAPDAIAPSLEPAGAEASLTARHLWAVVNQNGTWLATFEGDCGRPYKYSIKMEGRSVGRAVLFQGTADLGAQDGGVYDWIGRATATEFIGFYTNAFSTGTFSLTRAK